MAAIPTIRVRRKSDGSECTINVSDFDADLHEEIKPGKDAGDGESEGGGGKKKSGKKPGKDAGDGESE